MARFTLPRDLYHGKGIYRGAANLKGKKAIVVVGGGSMKRFGFLDKVEGYLKRPAWKCACLKTWSRTPLLRL